LTDAIPPIVRTDEQARALLAEELDRLAPRRDALGDAGVHAVAGWRLEQAMEWEASLIAWRRACELDPADAGSVFHVGACLLETSKFAAAADAFRRAIELDAATPRLDWFDEDPEYRLGNAHHAAGEFDEAVAAYERSAARNELGVDALREAARVHLHRKAGREALDVLHRLEKRAVRLTIRAEVQALRAEAEALLRRGG
jgi:tetratricopeptide (TPR) repeat protein